MLVFSCFRSQFRCKCIAIEKLSSESVCALNAFRPTLCVINAGFACGLSAQTIANHSKTHSVSINMFINSVRYHKLLPMFCSCLRSIPSVNSALEDMKQRLRFLRRRHTDSSLDSTVRPSKEEVEKWANSFRDLMSSRCEYRSLLSFD